MTATVDVRESPAAARNAAPILAALRAHLGVHAKVLEIASGTGQHAVAFAEALPTVLWTPTDPDETARRSIAARRFGAGLPNLAEPRLLDASDLSTWPEEVFDAVVCINMIHISPWAATQGLMAGVASLLKEPGGLLALYGPYREGAAPLATSNAAFDDDLRARNPAWGLRERNEVVAEARSCGLVLTRRVEMPANNLMLLFRRA